MSRRLWCAALAALAVGVVATPAFAGSDAGDPAGKAASIDDLRASDAELTAAITTLDGEVAAQQQKVQSAQQALDSATQALGAVEERLAGIQAQTEVLKAQAADRAIQEYMRPHDNDANKAMGDGSSLGDASRRAAILRQVNDDDRNAMDQLRAARVDLSREQKAAIEARDLADKRRADEQRELDQLNATRAEKQRLDASLQDRIKTYAEEDAASERVGSSSSQGRASRGGEATSIEGRVSASGMQWPSTDHKINSPFGGRWGRQHQGVDIEAKVGTPIYAAKAGTVTFAGVESGYGNYTCIDHGGGFSTCYAHQSAFRVGKGDSVQSGQLIGLAGNTGASQGAHLHFETRVNGKPENPMNYLP